MRRRGRPPEGLRVEEEVLKLIAFYRRGKIYMLLVLSNWKLIFSRKATTKVKLE